VKHVGGGGEGGGTGLGTLDLENARQKFVRIDRVVKKKKESPIEPANPAVPKRNISSLSPSRSYLKE
jgi:hypothetical protein